MNNITAALTKLEWTILNNLANDWECPATICPEAVSQKKGDRMKKSFAVLAVLAGLLIVTAVGAAPTKITLLHVNDTHSHLAPFGPKDLNLNGTLGGLSKAASVIVAEKASKPSAIFVHGGDFMHGDFFFNEYLGVAELELLQALGLDVMVLGNHEFDLGPDFLSEVLSATWPTGGNFPILSTNLVLTKYPVLGNWVTTDPTLIKEVDGVKVGFFGLTTPFVINALPAPAVLRADLAVVASESVQALQAQGAQVVICLAHLGLDLSRQIAAAVPGINVIVNAHDHVELAQPEEIGSPGDGTTLIVSAGAYYRWVGRLTLAVDGDVVSLVDYQLIDIDQNVPEAPEVAAVVQALEAGIVARYGDVYHTGLAKASGTIPVSVNPACPERDTPVGDLWTDAYRARTGTDIAVEVNGYLDEPLPNGILVGADIFRVNSGGLPDFDANTGALRVAPSRLATFILSGAQLVQALETALIASEDTFPQVSGMNFDYDLSRPPGQRVIVESIRVQGLGLQADHPYTLTVNEVVLMFLPLLGISVQDPQVLSDVGFEAVRDLVESRGLIQPLLEGRIRDVSMIDNTPPQITGISANPSVLWPPNHKMVGVTVNYNSTDNCGQPTCQIGSVTSNESISSSDFAIMDSHHVNLLAERKEKGSGRIYTITINCEDTSGNSSSQAVMVTVPHDQGKK